jgi:hypothetical protein
MDLQGEAAGKQSMQQDRTGIERSIQPNVAHELRELTVRGQPLDFIKVELDGLFCEVVRDALNRQQPPESPDPVLLGMLGRRDAKPLAQDRPPLPGTARTFFARRAAVSSDALAC